jgi:hypothetical protein
MVAIGGVALVLWNTIRWRRLASSAVIAEIYARLVWYAARLGVRVRASDTPNEFAEKFAARLANAEQNARGLVELYVQSRYGRQVIDLATRKRAMQMWRRLRGVLWKLWAKKKIKSEG